MRNRFQSTSRLLAGTLLLALAAVILAGLAIAGPGQGKGASASQYGYGAAGKAYGKTKITICHKGHTIRIAAPAWKAHQKHAGDHLGAC
jgi:hypothetical protein